MLADITLEAVLWSCLGFFAVCCVGLVAWIFNKHLSDINESTKETKIGHEKQTVALQEISINMVAEMKDRPTWDDVDKRCNEVADAKINQHVIDHPHG